MIQHYRGTTKTGNEWRPGNVVKAGFLKLRVTGVRKDHDDYGYLKDVYELVSLDGSKHYDFYPHGGLVRTN